MSPKFGKAENEVFERLEKAGKKETSPDVSTLAAHVLNGYNPTREEILQLAGSVLGQDETKGQKKNRKRKKD